MRSLGNQKKSIWFDLWEIKKYRFDIDSIFGSKWCGIAMGMNFLVLALAIVLFWFKIVWRIVLSLAWNCISNGFGARAHRNKSRFLVFTRYSIRFDLSIFSPVPTDNQSRDLNNEFCGVLIGRLLDAVGSNGYQQFSNGPSHNLSESR